MGTKINCIRIYNKRKGVNTLSDKGKGKEEGECINPQVMRACAILQVLLLEALEKNHKKISGSDTEAAQSSSSSEDDGHSKGKVYNFLSKRPLIGIYYYL